MLYRKLTCKWNSLCYLASKSLKGKYIWDKMKTMQNSCCKSELKSTPWRNRKNRTIFLNNHYLSLLNTHPTLLSYKSHTYQNMHATLCYPHFQPVWNHLEFLGTNVISTMLRNNSVIKCVFWKRKQFSGITQHNCSVRYTPMVSSHIYLLVEYIFPSFLPYIKSLPLYVTVYYLLLM